ncbi:NADH-quinone oxidoreductase subunit C [Paenibacillus nanensis]|uniref:NADH-quinone oxidoreductase subunit C n=1 Tax=Paenibacillus nanensis TaxID=393251 RepID=A0A3A1UXH9_9BACL|nr:NADH-quinone oxidoreductase subunit C [Paenibacillus nanensis]RIX51023.1 NADH-quinone oxidoreductase subunit C [Paenibacillus nanensis]
MSEEENKRSEEQPPAAETEREAEAPKPAVDPEREAKLKAAAEARAARAAAKAKAEAEAAQAAEAAEPEAPKEPSKRQPDLDRVVRVLSEALGAEAIQEAGLNELNGDMPVIVLDKASWPKAAPILRDHEELGFTYLRNVSGVDYETHLEVVYHLLSMASKADVAIKLRTDREEASIPSATPTWQTANWNEREIYDLLGITFPGHPDLRRIMMPDDWVGHPLRKDYEPLDSEV